MYCISKFYDEEAVKVKFKHGEYLALEIIEKFQKYCNLCNKAMNRRYDTSEGDRPLGSDSDDLQLNSRMANRYNTPWWASVGDGPLGFGPDNPQLNSRMTLQMLERLCENGPLYAVEVRYGGTKYGKVEVKCGRILIHSFQIEEPVSPTESKYISLPELLSRFNNGSSELPKTVFLRVTPDGGRDDSFEVIIETDGLTPRAKNFILLCSALKGPSYKGDPTKGYTSCYSILSSSPPLVEGIRDDFPKILPKEGGVYGMGEGHSMFWIRLEDQLSYNLPKFGVVVAGLQRLKDLQGRKVLIEECGLVI